jgi:hypothetical protein
VDVELEIPRELLEALTRSADQNGRTLNEEILSRLQQGVRSGRGLFEEIERRSRQESEGPAANDRHRCRW